jgi:hypothetical protein
MGNVPGLQLWRWASAKDSRPTKRLAVGIGWLGQSAISLLVVVTLVLLSRWFFSRVEIVPLLRWVYWAFLLYVYVAPVHRSRQVACESETIFNEPYYRVSLMFTMATTVVGFIVLCILLIP